MTDWLCIKCMHEFPDAGVKKQPEYVGMALFLIIGAALVLFALACLYTFLTGSRDVETAVYGGLAALCGAGAISMGMQFRKGVKAICPACGKPQGVPADGKIAAEVRKTRKQG